MNSGLTLNQTIVAICLVMLSPMQMLGVWLLARDPSAPIVLRPPFGQYSNHAYIYDFDFPEAVEDPAFYENDVRIGHAHASVAEIADIGNGRHDFRELNPVNHLRGILFSTSDNSNPNTNGRLYRVYNPNAKNPRYRAP